MFDGKVAMTDVDALFDVFGEGEESASAVPVATPKNTGHKNKKGDSSAIELLKRRREEAAESHGEEAKRLKTAVNDEIRLLSIIV